jgi:HPt (histidine-containing phosphotransfer) domain-containing protein
MNDFLAKPIEAEKLNAALGRWLPPEKIKTDPYQLPDTTAQDAGDSQHDRVYDAIAAVAGLDAAKGLGYAGGSKGMYLRVLRQFHGELPSYVGEIRSFFTAKNWPQYAIRMHAMKSVFANIGADDISGMARELEDAAKANDPALCAAGTERALEAMLALWDRLTPLLAQREPQSKTRKDLDFLVRKLKLLKNLCVVAKTREVNAVASELRGVSAGQALDGPMEEMIQALDSYDYNAAIPLIDSLLEALVNAPESAD